MIKSRRDGSKVVQDWVEAYFQPSLRDWSSFQCNPGLTSWAKFSSPFGTEFGNGVLTHALEPVPCRVVMHGLKAVPFKERVLTPCPLRTTFNQLVDSRPGSIYHSTIWLSRMLPGWTQSFTRSPTRRAGRSCATFLRGKRRSAK